MKTRLPVCIVWMILSFQTINLFGQIRIEFRGNNSWNGNPDNLWVMESVSTATTAPRVYVQASLSDQSGKQVFQTISNPINLPIGRHNFSLGEITSRQAAPLEPSNISKGNYLLCLSLIRVQDNQTVANTCSNIQVDILEERDDAKKGKAIVFAGNMRLYGQFSNRISLFDAYDPSYLNLEIQPKLTIKGLPFSGQVFLSTQENSLRYDLNTGGINFDVHQFRQQMLQKFRQKLGEQKGRLAKGLPMEGEFGQTLEKLRTERIAKIRESFRGKIPKNLEEDLAKARKAGEEAQRIEEILSLSTFKELDKDWENWVRELGYDPELDYEELRKEVCEKKPETCKKHMQLLAKKEEYEKLKARKKQLESLQAKYKKLKKYGEQIKELQALEAGDYQSLLQDRDLLKKLPLFEKGQKVLTSIQKLGIGTVFPFYSPLTLDGISLNGWDMEFQPGKLYVATSGGKLGRSAFYGLTDTSENREGKLIATKIGYGKVEGNHLYSTLMMGQWEDKSEETPMNAGRQLLVGLEGQVNLLRDKWLIKGEWVRVMESLSDTETPEAWSITSQAQLFEGKTLLNGNYEKLMPGYFSIGAPLLLKESERFNFEVTQSFLKNKFQARAYYRKNANQLLPHSFESVSVKSAGLSLRFQADKLPYFQADFAPYYQDFGSLDTLSPGRNPQANNGVMTIQSGYMYHLGSWQLQSTLSYSRQVGGSEEASSAFSSSLLGWNQLIQFTSIWGLNTSVSYIHSQYSADWDKTWTCEASGYVRLKSGLYSSLGINYLKEQGSEGIYRRGIFSDNTLPIGKKIQAQLRLEYSHNENYRPDIPYFKEYIIQGGLTYSW